MKLFKYELYNTLNNFFMTFFAVVFPAALTVLIIYGVTSSMSEDIKETVSTAIFLRMIWMIPLSSSLVGMTAIVAQEYEQNIPLRMMLFGYKFRQILQVKLICQFLTITLGIVTMSVVGFSLVGLKIVSIGGSLSILFFVYLLGLVLSVFGYALASIFKQFSKAYGISMILYFLLMILAGMMGINFEQLPKFVQGIARQSVVTQLSLQSLAIYNSEAVQWGSLWQSWFLLFALTAILVVYAHKKSKAYS